MSKPDVALQTLVDVVTHTQAGISITVTADGAPITGVLISAEEFATNVAQQISRAHDFTSEDVKGFNLLFEHLGEAARGEFLHLRNAHLVTGAEVPREEGGWWRIRIADVSGWSCGQMSPLR
ncbi:hypothetical protein [Planomonospora venezuelensis]|uniref:Uncharacterized protein n=1 Tax=Planomonospora venezuelensis TaxID=1999 RepID=A0A841DB01_PLAVE|nr:hypothetical protein [Planomonospora venezuelensis]MBB5967822.1 hypothetical protein [Planomonospora venezuelensis]GIM66993.1 hypothetical protein Pve01_88660 [Planomonospora venezuelensis]